MGDLTDRAVAIFKSSIAPASAMSRYGRIPITFSSDPSMGGNEATGMYGGGLLGNSIDVNTPSKDPLAQDLTFRHELAHAALAKANLPTNYNTFHTVDEPPVWGAQQTSKPSNNFNWASSGREGRMLEELPAYMTSYSQKQQPFVTPAVRDQYMKDLVEHFQKTNQPQTAARLLQLMQGRVAVEKIY